MVCRLASPCGRGLSYRLVMHLWGTSWRFGWSFVWYSYMMVNGDGRRNWREATLRGCANIQTCTHLSPTSYSSCCLRNQKTSSTRQPATSQRSDSDGLWCTTDCDGRTKCRWRWIGKTMHNQRQLLWVGRRSGIKGFLWDGHLSLCYTWKVSK